MHAWVRTRRCDVYAGTLARVNASPPQQAGCRPHRNLLTVWCCAYLPSLLIEVHRHNLCRVRWANCHGNFLRPRVFPVDSTTKFACTTASLHFCSSQVCLKNKRREARGCCTLTFQQTRKTNTYCTAFLAAACFATGFHTRLVSQHAGGLCHDALSRLKGREKRLCVNPNNLAFGWHSGPLMCEHS